LGSDVPEGPGDTGPAEESISFLNGRSVKQDYEVFKKLKNKQNGNYRSTDPSIWRLSTCLLLLLAACTGGPNPPRWEDILLPSATPPEKPSVPTSNHLVVYLDTSGSMAGYVAADRQGQTIFSRSLQEIRNFITIISPPVDIVVRRVDSSISSAYPDSYLTEASVNRGVFTGKETDLAGAISLFEKPIKPKAEAGSNSENKSDAAKDDEETPLPPARFHVLITDGVQSLTNKSADSSCLAGSDQTCVRKRILSLLSKGWGSYVIGVRSEFQGKVYSEVTRGNAISYESKRRDPQSFRPFYIYIFSPDRAALDSLVGTLTTRLRPLLAREDGMRTLSLTSAYSQGPTDAQIKVVGDATKLMSESKSGRHLNPTGFTLRLAIGSDKKGPVPFQITVKLPWSPNIRDGGTPQELGGLVNWTVVPLNGEAEAKRAQRARYPEVKITGQKLEADGSVTLNATAQYPGGATGDPAWRSYCLEGKLNLDHQVPPWIAQWSTNLDTTTESANKTLYLESTLLGLWNNPVLKEQPVAQIYFRVGP
jgi:hypothetical protein